MKTSLSLSIRRVGIKYHWASFSVPLNEFQQFDVNVFYESSLSSRQPFRGVGSNWLFHHPIVWSRSRSISSWAVGWYVAWLVLCLVELFFAWHSGNLVECRAEVLFWFVSNEGRQVGGVPKSKHELGCQQEPEVLNVINHSIKTMHHSPRPQSHRWGCRKGHENQLCWVGLQLGATWGNMLVIDLWVLVECEWGSQVN